MLVLGPGMVIEHTKRSESITVLLPAASIKDYH